MPTAAANLQTAYDNLCLEFAAITAPGAIRKTNYSVDGRNYDWLSYRKWLSEEIKQTRELLALAEGPAEQIMAGET